MTTELDNEYEHTVGSGFRWFFGYLAAVLLAACAVLYANHSDASDYTRDGGTATWQCCADKACTTVISQHDDPVLARDACGKLTDGDGVTRYTRSNPFSITKAAPPPPVNRAPTISGTPVAAVVTGQAYAFTPTATDADGDTLSFTIANKPTWATFSTTTGALNGTPAAANVGITSSIMITVSDGKLSASTPVFSITVTAAPPPSAPPAPANLTITMAPNVTHPANTNITLKWDAVAACTEYEIYRCIGASCTVFNWLRDEPTTTYTVADQLPSSTQKYKVRCWKPTIGAYTPVWTLTTPVNPTTPPPAGTGTATLNWTPPTHNSDGSTLVDLAGYRVLYGTSASVLTSTVQIANPAATTYVVDKLTAGTWYFAMTAYNTAGNDGVASNVASKVVVQP
jgi:hypothetical protein